MSKLAKGVKGGRIAMVGLGVLARLIGLPETAIVAAVAASIGRKKPEALAASEAAVLLGANAAPDVAVPKLPLPGKPKEAAGRSPATRRQASAR